MNWAPYAVYNPQLWHWPEDWPLVRLSPTVEPFIVIGYALFYFGPFFPAMALLRRLQARAAMDSFVWRHPLWSLAGLVLVMGFVFDAILEVSLVRTGLYIYSQVDPVGLVVRRNDLPVPAHLGVRVRLPGDGSGRGALLSRRHGTHAGREAGAAPSLVAQTIRRWATFLMMFAIFNVAYFIYGGSFAAHPKRRGSRPPSRVRIRIPKPRSTIPRDTTNARASPAPTSRVSGTRGRRGSSTDDRSVNPVKRGRHVQEGRT